MIVIILSVLLFLCIVASLRAEAPRTIGISNSNPGNIRPNHWWLWKNRTGVDAYGYAIFASDKDGLRAMRKVLRGYHKRGVVSVRAIVKRWVTNPTLKPKDQKRDICNYELAMCQQMDVSPQETLDMGKGYVMARVAKAIIYCENGSQPYPERLMKQVFHY